MRNYKVILILMMMTVFLFVGCESVSLTEEEEQIYVAYAVNAVINHDNNYVLKLKDVEIETETTTKWYSEEDRFTTEPSSDGNNGSQQNPEEETTVINVETDMNTIMKLDGISVEYTDYEIGKTYPNEDSMAFVLTAVDGSNLVVLKFNVKNETNEDIVLDMIAADMNFKGIFNGQVKANCQTTLLNNALNTYKGTISAGESKEMVLVYQISERSLSNVSTIKLEVENGDLSSTIILKK